ncbi:MAG: DUF2029 domain-containing protein [Chloroflexi bacterium]|nr:DUF2029 domain-containing protein [Chloroflexota bacterium]
MSSLLRGELSRDRLRERARAIAQPITLVLLAGLLIRLGAALLEGHGADLFVFTGWARDLGANGPWDFYDSEFVADYFPGYLYILMVIGLADRLFTFSPDEFDYALKMPSVIADVVAAYVLYRLLDDRTQWVRTTAAAVYLALPTVLFIGAVWGQADSLLALGLLLCVFYMSRGRPLVAAAVYVVTFLVKPQAIAALPILAFWGLREHPRRVWLQASVTALVTMLVLILPFFPTSPWDIFDQLNKATDLYAFNSSFAFNFWGMWGWFRGDDITHLGIEWRVWGIAITVLANVAIIYFLSNRREVGMLALGVALSVLAFDLFLTRVHERYLFPAFLPLLAACFLLNSRVLTVGFVVLSICQFFSLYYSFYHPNFNPEFEPSMFYTHDIIRMIDYSPSSWTRPGSMVTFLFSFSAVMSFPVFLTYIAWFRRRRSRTPPHPT